MNRTKITFFLLSLLLLSLLFAFSACSNTSDEFNTADLNLKEYITLGAYKGIVTNKINITEAMIEEKIQEELKFYAELSLVTDRAAANGDTVNVDFIGRIDGKEFLGGSAEDYDITLGEDKMIDGFTEGILGMMTGETKVLNLCFPDPYSANTDLSGQPVEFTVTVNKISERVYPQLTDENIGQYTSFEYSTVSAYRSAIKISLENEQKATRYSELLSTVVDNSTVFSYPEQLISYYKTLVIAQYEDLAKQNGVSLEKLLQIAYQCTVEDLNNFAQIQAQVATKQELVIFAIAQNENITISNEEYQAGLKILFETTENQCDSMKAYEEACGKLTIEKNLLWEKVLRFLELNAVIQ